MEGGEDREREGGVGGGDGEKERERIVCLDRIRGRFIVEFKVYIMVKFIV